MKNTDLFSCATKAAAISASQMKDLNVTFAQNEYELTFHTEYMDYVAYIGLDGELTGLISEPLEVMLTGTTDMRMDGLCA